MNILIMLIAVIVMNNNNECCSWANVMKRDRAEIADFTLGKYPLHA